MKLQIFSTAALFALQTTLALAQSKEQVDMCKKISHAGHRASCMCHISNGGFVEPRAGGGYQWWTPGGASNMALQNCLSKI
jgi:hypothetical protein